MRLRHLSAVLLLFLAARAIATTPALMPWPSQIKMQSGALALDKPLRIDVTGCAVRVTHAVERFRAQLSINTGNYYNHQDTNAADNPPLTIRCDAVGLPVQTVAEDESYSLVVNATSASVHASTPLGAMHALQTILQLATWAPEGWQLPAVQIDDRPRFPWRGLMLDVSRHFMPFDQLKREVDGMAAVKLNVLHLHLSDDQGWRVESRKAPRLQQFGSEGMFYTQEQIRELVLYARDRGIRIVPEFDVPGHSTAILMAYPELASDTPATRIVRNQSDRQQPPLDPTNEKTYKLLDTVFSEMAKLFPDEYFHIGGDEVSPKYWAHNPRIQSYMQSHNLKTADELQAMFNQRLLAIVTRNHKHMIGWDEILVPGLPKETMIQSWRGPASLAAAARQGYAAILSAGYYLDLMYPASQHYLVEPLSGDAATLTPEQQKLILGGEAAQWAEYITPENADNRLWPRTAAIAERFWSPQSMRDVQEMYARLDRVSTQLEFLGLAQRSSQERMLRRITGPAPFAQVMTLAGTLEPVKEYERGETHEFDADLPLNQFIDALSPESDTARHDNNLIAHVLATPQDAAARHQLRLVFESWRDNEARLAPWLGTSQPLSSIAVFSPVLAQLGVAGLQALDAAESGVAVARETHAAHLDAVKAAEQHHAMLLMAIAPGVRKLVEAEQVAP